MDILHLTPKDYQVMPWKNGKGTTTEIVKQLLPNSNADFLWRISVAKVEGASDFSLFPGIDRTIVQLSGPSLTLEHRELGIKRQLKWLRPYSFSGDLKTSATMAEGTAQDFNVMVNRKGARSDVTAFVLGKEERYDFFNSAPWIIVYCTQGQLRIKGQDHSLDIVLNGNDSLLATLGPKSKEEFAARLEGLEEDTAFIVVEIRPVSLLERLPNGSAIFPALAMIFLFVIATAWKLSYGNPTLWVSKESLLKGEYWRLFTALFVHGDFLHLAHNAPIFLIFGFILRAYFGAIAFPVMAILIGMISNLLTVWSYEPQTELLGASGMVYGMVSLWLVLYLTFERNLSLSKRLMRSFGFALMMLFPQSFEPKVSYLAHATGFGVGIILGVPFAAILKRLKIFQI